MITTVTHFESVAAMLKSVSLDILLPGIEDEFQAVGLLEAMHPAPSRKEGRVSRRQEMIVFGLDTSPDASGSVVGVVGTATPGTDRFRYSASSPPKSTGTPREGGVCGCFHACLPERV